MALGNNAATETVQGMSVGQPSHQPSVAEEM